MNSMNYYSYNLRLKNRTVLQIFRCFVNSLGKFNISLLATLL